MDSNKQLSEPIVNYQSLDDQRAFQLITAIQQGMEYDEFERMTQWMPFHATEWADYLNISLRSLQRYKKDRLTLNAPITERILEITMLFKYGVSVFEDQQHFENWLNQDNIALGNRKPTSLLNTSFGIRLVKDELNRIAHGIFA